MRIAFDISILAQQFARGFGKTGIYRTIEETLGALASRTDVEVTVTGMCGVNPIASTFLAEQYVRHGEQHRFLPGVRSRLKLGSLYTHLYRAYVRSGRSGRVPAMPLRIASRIVGEFSQWDAAPSLALACDLLHSTYLGLPSRRLTGRTTRVLTVYDLIPIVAPQFVRPSHSVDVQRILDTIDADRDWVACISEYAKQEFCGHTGMDPERVFVTRLAAADHFHPEADTARVASVRRRFGIPEGPYILSIASLEPRKNLAHLIRSFVRLRVEQPSESVSLVLTGARGWGHDEILRAAAEVPNFAASITFTGHVPDADLSAIYTGAAAFVFPSLHEGFGLPPLEAMQCGVPVITSNATSLPEVVGDAALMVDPKDSDALCQAMLHVLNDATLRNDLKTRGLRRAQDFSWSSCADRTVELYQAATGSS